MTDEQARLGKLEDKYHSIDKRQESFEEFTKAAIQRLEEGIKSNNERMDKMDERMDKIDARMDKMDERMDRLEAEMKAMNKELGSKIDNLAKFLQSLTITATIGVLGIAGSVIYFVYSVTSKQP